jgi:hypothetical protein
MSAAEADTFLVENGPVGGRVSEFDAPGWYWAKHYSERHKCGCCYSEFLVAQSAANRELGLRAEAHEAVRRLNDIKVELGDAEDRGTMPPPGVSQ